MLRKKDKMCLHKWKKTSFNDLVTCFLSGSSVEHFWPYKYRPSLIGARKCVKCGKAQAISFRYGKWDISTECYDFLANDLCPSIYGRTSFSFLSLPEHFGSIMLSIFWILGLLLGFSLGIQEFVMVFIMLLLMTWFAAYRQ